MSIMLEMKRQTADYHAATENILREHLFSCQLSEHRYYDVINTFYAAYSSLEAAISIFPLTSGLLKRRSKIELLKKDLIYLRSGYPVRAPYISAPFLPDVTNEASALGVMYVMEGSTLGGKIIINHLMKYDWMSVHLCGNFFSNYGSSRRYMWNEFCQVMDNFFAGNDQTANHLVNGAKIAFEYIYSLLIQIR